MHALSLRQPWAALVVSGRKTIEVRRWPTRRLGRVLIHAAKLTDDRPETRKHLTADILEAAGRRGGIVGSVEIVRCVTYRNLDEFLRDQSLHLNEAAWFQEPRLYGFELANPEPWPFRACPGQNRFFTVDDVGESGS